MQKKSAFAKIALLILAFAITFFVAFFGSVFTNISVDSWYLTLIKPNWTPPAIAFPIAWTILYTLIGISFWLVLISPSSGKGNAYLSFFVQMFFNFSWSFVFFYLRSPSMALINILVLWLAILWNMFAFHRCSRPAAYLLIPYFLWVSFATSLNIGIWILN
jgi:benzodiazapine receptor